MDGTIRRGFADVAGGQVHYREAGRGLGRTLVLIHASPGSSLMLAPLIAAFGGHAACDRDRYGGQWRQRGRVGRGAGDRRFRRLPPGGAGGARDRRLRSLRHAYRRLHRRRDRDRGAAARAAADPGWRGDVHGGGTGGDAGALRAGDEAGFACADPDVGLAFRARYPRLLAVVPHRCRASAAHRAALRRGAA